jgi:uncharacterized protein (UPF0276 family)
MIPKLGLSLMPEEDFLLASEALFDSGEVEALEWSFDMCWGKSIPERCLNLLNQYSQAGSLLGHGVSFSLLTAKRTKRQELWLQYLQKEVQRFNYQKISEHFGFLNTEVFTQGAPLSAPFIPELLQTGVENLKQIKKIANVPIGLENLGFAFSKEDVIEQGKFLTALLDAVDGFLLLDIHNVYCHVTNFDLSFEEVLKTLPLHRLQEVHISGGAFRTVHYENKDIYCDSHDAAIPRDLFDFMEKNLSLFSRAETIIYERMGNTIHSQYEADQFKDDFITLKSLIKKAGNEY